MVYSGRLRYSDYLACTQFCSELQQHPRHTNIRDHLFLSGIARLTQSQAVVAPIFQCFTDNRPWKSLHAIDSGWKDQLSRTATMNLFINNGPFQEPLAAQLKQRPQQSFALCLNDFYTDNQWRQLLDTLKISKMTPSDDMIVSIKKEDRDWAAGLIVCRSSENVGRYTKRDAAILLLIQNLTYWLRCQDAEAALNQDSSLPPRLSQVLNLLCQGCSEKQISSKLSLSRHTVHEHVKRLHRRFNVQTRSELLVKVLHQNHLLSLSNEPELVSQI